jgi:ABC-type multidrug transport system fused ATPase/permease subunit
MDVISHFAARFERTREEEISLEDYLAECKRNPLAYATAAERMLKAIGEPASIDTRNDPRLSRLFANKVIKVYPAFAEFYGMEDAIEQVVSYFRHAAQGLEEKKQILYLLGPVGGGKSSIADLLAGLYEPTGGRILIDGEDLRDLKLSSWQQRLGVVSQDTFLFNASIASNIGFGVNRASLDDIKDAAAKAQAAGFIADLPEGYETKIGERGYRLSGGQRQRISLARAILRKPELLILDEATSALDSQSERLVQQAIEQFERQHTVLVIAHHLSTIVNADVICVMSEGKILERGPHHELLALDGMYAKLWSDQSKHPQMTSMATTQV